MNYEVLMNRFLNVISITYPNETYNRTVETFESEYNKLSSTEKIEYLNYLKDQFKNYTYKEIIDRIINNPNMLYNLSSGLNNWETNKKEALDTIQVKLDEFGSQFNSRPLNQYGFQLIADVNSHKVQESLDNCLQTLIDLNMVELKTTKNQFIKLFQPLVKFSKEDIIHWTGSQEQLHCFIKELIQQRKISNKSQQWKIAVECFINAEKTPLSEYNHKKLSHSNRLKVKENIESAVALIF